MWARTCARLTVGQSQRPIAAPVSSKHYTRFDEGSCVTHCARRALNPRVDDTPSHLEFVNQARLQFVHRCTHASDRIPGLCAASGLEGLARPHAMSLHATNTKPRASPCRSEATPWRVETWDWVIAAWTSRGPSSCASEYSVTWRPAQATRARATESASSGGSVFCHKRHTTDPKSVIPRRRAASVSQEVYA